MRPRKQDRHLPACLYYKHGSYWLVKKGKWHNVGKDYSEAMQEYARLQALPVKSKNGMAELIDKVLTVHGKSIAQSTQNQYRLAGERLKVILAEFEPHQVRPKHIAAIKTQLADTPAQCNRILAFLSVVFNYALEWQLVESHPCRGIRRYKERSRTRYVSHDEFNALLAHLPEPMHNLFTLVYLTGQRISDVLHLHQSNLTEQGITFAQQKTSTKMRIHITEDIAEVLSRIQPNREGWLFHNSQGRRLGYETARLAFVKACKAAGIADTTSRDLRAKALTDADEEGKSAQKLGGHKNASTTRIYLRGRKPIEATAPTLPKKR